jgi:anthranilate synthase component 1
MGEGFFVIKKERQMYYPSLQEVKELKGKGNIVPVYREISADLETPVSAYLKTRRSGNSFLLESVEGGDHMARYSFIGTEPYKLIKTYSSDNKDPLKLIAAELNCLQHIHTEGLPRFCGGAVGYLSYETVGRFEEIIPPLSDPLALPEAAFMLCESMLVFDHVSHTVKALSHLRLDSDIEAEYAAAVKRIEEMTAKLNTPLDLLPTAAPVSNTKNNLVSNFTKEDFEAAVSKIKEYISDGEAIQVVLSQRFSQTTFASPFAIYRALRSINPSPYMFYLDFEDFQIIGASPEILVRVEDGKVTTRPLAGTRPRGRTPAEDKQMEEELKADEKEQAEHIMLVDLGRNDVGRVSRAGSVKVSELMEVERYSHVMHLVTHVEGELRKDMDAFDALRACFPAGTVSGAPKIRAMQIISELEPQQRGPYAGAAGYFSFSGNMDMAISIRTMVLKDSTAHIQAGAGIVYDSQPHREYLETQNKAKALLTALKRAENTDTRNV